MRLSAMNKVLWEFREGAPEPGFPTLTLTVLFPSLCPLSMPVLFCVNIFYIAYICKHPSYDDYI